MTPTLRSQAFKVLDREGSIMDVARAVSRILESDAPGGAVIGGIAVVLHGHLRTTKDVDVYASEPKALSEALLGHGFTFDSVRREFWSGDVPVHLVTLEQLGSVPGDAVVIDGVRTVSLADLLAMKLRTGSSNPLRAQDLADVIGLIRVHGLDGSFAGRLDKSLRPSFRKLARAVGRDG